GLFERCEDRWAAPAWPECRRVANSSSILRLNAGRSAGLRLETSPLSTTTSSSTHFAPAFLRSACSEGHDVILRPFATPASIKVQGPWQIAATGLAESKN